MLDERGVQTVPTQFSILKNRGNVESMLKESSNQFKLDSTPFQQAINISVTLSTMLNDLLKRPGHLVQQCVERMLNWQMLRKPFKRAFSPRTRLGFPSCEGPRRLRGTGGSGDKNAALSERKQIKKKVNLRQRVRLLIIHSSLLLGP